MATVVFIAVVACAAILHGCSPSGRPATGAGSQPQVLSSASPATTDAKERTGSVALEVKQFALTKDSLRLDYHVTNLFPHDIWVCTSISNYATDPNSSAETLIRDGTLQVKRRAHLEQRANVTAALFYAVYHRLPPGASCPGTVLMPLPVRSDSPVVYTGLPVSPVVLKQVVFELGYFVQDLRTLLPEGDRSKPYRVYRNGYFSRPDTAFIPYIIPRRWDKLGTGSSLHYSLFVWR